MLASIIGGLFGDDDESDAEDDTDLLGSDLAGSTSDDSLMPGGGSSGGNSAMDDDDLLGGDEFGGEMMDDEMSLDGMGGMDADGGDTSSEFESRVEEIENEVGSLASTVNTVQSENENISESLEDIEDNIRKLLEVYEMVTQGVNPFVEGDSLRDTLGGGGGDAPGSGGFEGSLFDSGGDEEADEEMGEDIADAAAEDFLDESIIDDDDEFDDFDEFDELEDEDSLEGEDEGMDGDLSFDELKDAYDSGEAEWGDGDEEAVEDEFDSQEDDFEDELETAGDELEEELAADDDAFEMDDEGFEDTGFDAATVADAAEPTASEDGTSRPWVAGDRPYVASIPSAYNTEFVVMDWLEDLIDDVGLNGAARTIRFYSSIDWVSEEVESYLQTMLNGFDGGPDVVDPEPRSSLGVDHRRSLWRISQITTPESDRVSYAEWVDQQDVLLRAELEEVTESGDNVDDEAAAEIADGERSAVEYDADAVAVEPIGDVAPTDDVELEYDAETATAETAPDESAPEEPETWAAVSAESEDILPDEEDDAHSEALFTDPDDAPVEPLLTEDDATGDATGTVEVTEFDDATRIDDPTAETDETVEADDVDAPSFEETTPVEMADTTPGSSTDDPLEQEVGDEQSVERAAEPHSAGEEPTDAEKQLIIHDSQDHGLSDIEQAIDADSGQMIWVDSEAVHTDAAGQLDGDEIPQYDDEKRNEFIKDLLVADGNAEIDRWREEYINSLFVTTDETEGESI